MKRFYGILAALIMALVLMMSMTACGGNEGAADTSAPEETAGQEEEQPAETRTVVKTIEGVDEDLGSRLPLMIDSITLYDDGTVAVIPLDELRKNEIKGDEEAVYPFEESGEVSDIYVVDYGTVSAVNGRALVEDHIFAVLDTVGGRDDFTSIEAETGEDGTTITAITEDGESVVLDYSLNFDDPEEEN